MIKLKELLSLNKMKYSSDVKSRHQKKMNMETKLILDEMRVPTRPFPENSSKETRDELKWLLNYNNRMIDKDYVKGGDDVNKVFKNYCKENNLEFEEKYYDKILEESTKTILSLKYHYNRPRPKQLADYYGMDEFEDYELNSMKTPSYPSGHSTQGHLIAELLGKEHSGHYNNFKELAHMISKSRLMARSHYPSDCTFGEQVAKYIIGKIK